MNTLNPFCDELAINNSNYCQFDGKTLTLPMNGGTQASSLTQFVHGQFRSLILQSEFPCLGGRSALNNFTYRFGLYSMMGSPEATSGLARDLCLFINERSSIVGEFVTFIASFRGPTPTDEVHFEKMLWQQLQALHNLDRNYFPWDPGVSSDPKNPRFSYSFGAHAFFLVGLNPSSSRWARKFAWPTLVFNAHDQFEKLRSAGKYESFKNAVRLRDTKLQGNINPNLADFGDNSDARQYAGRHTEDDWECPFDV